MRYFSDTLERLFDTQDELILAEKKHVEELEAARKRKEDAEIKQKALVIEREKRKIEVDAAFETAYKLRDKYVKDYGQYRFEYGLPAYTGSLLNLFGI